MIKRRTYSLKHTRSTLSMPTFDITSEFGACIVYTVVVILVVSGSSNAIAKHAFGERGQLMRRVFFEKSGGA